MNRNFLVILTITCISTLTQLALAQTDSIPNMPYETAVEYEIGGIKVIGAQYSDENAIIAITGLKVGEKIRIGTGATDISKALKSLWKLKLYSDVQIIKEKTIGNIVFLEIIIKEQPRYSRHAFKGVKKHYHDDLNPLVEKHFIKGGIVTESAKIATQNDIVNFFKEKGYLDATVNITEMPDDKTSNATKIEFNIDRGKRVKIQNITFTGNNNVKASKLRKLLDKTKRKSRIFASSKLIAQDYDTDKIEIIKHYNNIGYRDAQIISDSIWREPDGDLRIQINLDEGNKYHFRNIAWKGNSIYQTEVLQEILGIKKGDVYNKELLETRLRFSPDGRDVSTLYMDNGYLFFNVEPAEISAENDSIDLEVRIYEGPPATIDKVIIKGNDRTHEHVIRRELRTRPGQKFSRSDIVRSQREIVNLGYFNPENLQINNPINAQRGTVDIEYTVEEKPADQLELSAGWGGQAAGVIGTLGVSFKNFSFRNLLHRETWSPLPQGDGQTLSLRAQTNGRFFQSYNISFVEPWLGGKKPQSFSIGGFYNRYTNGASSNTTGFGKFEIIGGQMGLGSRLQFPDDNFVSNTTMSYQLLRLRNWYAGYFQLPDGSDVRTGDFNNFNFQQTIARNSINDPIFPREGSNISLTVQFTPPWSLLTGGSSFEGKEGADKFKLLEYHKWKFVAEWYTTLVDKLVLRARAKVGMLGFYNRKIGQTPFERFVLGGDGLSNQFTGFTGNDIISSRGYETNQFPANNGTAGASVYDKYTVELRYPLSLNPNSTIYVLAFAEGSNAWNRFRDFNPFNVKRSVGMGLRVFLPMFGTLGFDYGFGLDQPSLIESNARWTKYGNFNIILGFEPE
ncbi:MAG: outer membrane protein assembly factor BamA [Saprospiraceae bacterium]|nr:outer membrane protein assembly factor BamA [Saprospiraceae bacterium]MBP7679599.1 outer membrane protein assembly factor BamA [Saprospiraceae bacterium]